MSIEFIGIAATQRVGIAQPPSSGPQDAVAAQSEAGGVTGPAVQADYLRALAQTHEDSGFNRVLLAHSSSSPDGFIVADQVLTHTNRLGVLLAHRPGFVSPTLAARKFATLDAFHPGRVAMHVITGGDDADQARDGDFTDKVTRYRRTDDFLDVVRKEWSAAVPFDHDGEFYRIRQGFTSVRPEGRIPVYFGGASDDAVRVGSRHADVYAFWGEPLDGIRQRIKQVRDEAIPHGRRPRFSVSLRPIPAETEADAWDRAREILRASEARAKDPGSSTGSRLDHSQQRGSQRLLEYAAKANVHDKRLWTAIAKTTGASGNSTALVGSYEQVADSLLDYVRLGVSTLLIRGFSPLEDARDYKQLIDIVRASTDAESLSEPA